MVTQLGYQSLKRGVVLRNIRKAGRWAGGRTGSYPSLTVYQLRYILRGETGGSHMAARTSMLHVRVDEQLKAEATKKLANFGLTVSDAVRILLTRIAKE